MKIPLECLVFDFGGVISKKQDAERIREMAAYFDLSPDAFIRTYFHFRNQYDAGTIDYREFWGSIADIHRPSLTLDTMERLRELDNLSWSVIDQDMVSFLPDVRRSVKKMAVISNITPDLLRALRAQAAWLNHFDQLVFSCEVGTVKPEPEIYAVCLSRLNSPAYGCLFIDDTVANVEAARQAGMHGFHYQDLEGFRKELEGRYTLN